MGIPARSRQYNIQRLYQDPRVTYRYNTYSDGRITTFSTASNAVAHYVERSPKTLMPLIQTSSGKRRNSSNYHVAIFDRPAAKQSTNTRTIDIRTGKTAYPLVDLDGWMSPDVAYANLNSGARFSGFTCIHDDDAANQAIVTCMNKLGDQKVNIGAALAEARKTYNLLADTSITLFRTYLAVKRGNWRAVAQHLGLRNKDALTGKSSAARLLEVKYGWKPLIDTIYDCHEFFTESREKEYLVHAYSSSKREYSWSGEYIAAGGDTAYRHNNTYKAKGMCGLTASVSGEYQRVANRGGMLNPLSVAWELVPYSFVLDWYMPVGNVLQAYSDTAGLNFIDGYIGKVAEGTTTWDAISSSEKTSTYGVTTKTRSGTVVDRRFVFTRTGLRAFPIPGLYARQNWFDKKKGITALLLLRQCLG